MTEKNEALLLAEKMERKYSGCHEDEDGFLEMDASTELRRLHHNNQVLMDALWKACGDDEGVVNDTIASEGELK